MKTCLVSENRITKYYKTIVYRISPKTFRTLHNTMPYLRTPFSRENNDFTMIIFLIIHETNIYTLQIFLFNKLTKSRQNLYRKPQTRDTFLPKIRPQVSIHLRHRNLSPSSLFLSSLSLSLSLGAHEISSDLMSATPTFHLSIISSPVWLARCSRTLVPLCSLPLFTRRGNGGGRKGRKTL